MYKGGEEPEGQSKSLGGGGGDGLDNTAGRLMVIISVGCEAGEKKRKFPAYPGLEDDTQGEA